VVGTHKEGYAALFTSSRIHRIRSYLKHVTRMLLWQEYREGEPEGYQYSQFCDRYGQWAKTLPLSMREI